MCIEDGFIRNKSVEEGSWRFPIHLTSSLTICDTLPPPLCVLKSSRLPAFRTDVWSSLSYPCVLHGSGIISSSTSSFYQQQLNNSGRHMRDVPRRNSGSRHNDVLDTHGTAPRITSMISFASWPIYRSEKGPGYPLKNWLGRRNPILGCFGGRDKFLSTARNRNSGSSIDQPLV